MTYTHKNISKETGNFFLRGSNIFNKKMPNIRLFITTTTSIFQMLYSWTSLKVETAKAEDLKLFESLSGINQSINFHIKLSKLDLAIDRSFRTEILKQLACALENLTIRFDYGMSPPHSEHSGNLFKLSCQLLKGGYQPEIKTSITKKYG